MSTFWTQSTVHAISRVFNRGHSTKKDKVKSSSTLIPESLWMSKLIAQYCFPFALDDFSVKGHNAPLVIDSNRASLLHLSNTFIDGHGNYSDDSSCMQF